METHRAYCSALDREVRVFLRPVSFDETDPKVTVAPGIICIEHGEDCVGIRCPLKEACMARYESWFRR